MIAAVGFDAATIEIDSIEVAAFRSWVRGFEEDATVAQDACGKVIAGGVGQTDRIVAGHQGGLQLKAGRGAARVHDALASSIERRDGVLAESGHAAGRSAGQRDLPDLPGVAGALFAREENAKAVEGDGGVDGCGEAGSQRNTLAAAGDVDRAAAGEAIGARRFVMGCLGEKERRGR